MPYNFPSSERKFSPQQTVPDPARREFTIVARQYRNGDWALGARWVNLSPFHIRSYQLGRLAHEKRAAQSPYSALIWAQSLFMLDEEIKAAFR